MLQSQSTVFVLSQCWCARFGELPAINDIGGCSGGPEVKKKQRSVEVFQLFLSETVVQLHSSSRASRIGFSIHQKELFRVHGRLELETSKTESTSSHTRRVTLDSHSILSCFRQSNLHVCQNISHLILAYIFSALISL